MRHTRRGGSLHKQQVEDQRNTDIHSKVRGVFRAQASKDAPTGAIIERGKYFSIAGIDETEADHIVPRKSLTVKQLLAARTELETEPMPTRQLDVRDQDRFTSVSEALEHGRMIQTTDERLVWRLDRSLLIKGTPGSSLPIVKRDGFIKQGLNRRNTRVTENEQRMNADRIEEVIEHAIDVTDPESLE